METEASGSRCLPTTGPQGPVFSLLCLKTLPACPLPLIHTSNLHTKSDLCPEQAGTNTASSRRFRWGSWGAGGGGTGKDPAKLREKQQKGTLNLARFRRKTDSQGHFVPVLGTGQGKSSKQNSLEHSKSTLRGNGDRDLLVLTEMNAMDSCPFRFTEGCSLRPLP